MRHRSSHVPSAARPRRARATGITAAVLATTAALTLSACNSSGSGGGGGGQIGIGYFQSATIGTEVLVKGNSDLADKVGASIKLTPIDSGVTGLATLRSGRAFQFASGVGNPPVTGAIANDTKLKVIYAEYYDAAQLIVGSDIKTNGDLAGKTVGDLQGSSEDYEIRGWLKTQGLEGKVKVAGFPSEQAVEAAYKSGRIDAAYVEVAQAQDLLKDSVNRQVVTAQQIAKLGYASLNVLVVLDSYATRNKKTVQNLVCQFMNAQAKVPGAQGEKYITNGSKLVGATPKVAIAATKDLPFVSKQDQLTWFGTSADASTSKLADSYVKTGQFLKEQGRITTVPTAAQIGSHIDPTYVQQAVKDGCGA
ncbi:NitT/TauT family transport system substrate-binding protein [Jatrophihabitans endophyticus]|uniref:NitT/TauT family transport system substrate-binding protein n=1 Tax=Jatrophihabitans endophyticus TaxID=1206085 RepID=A0A1M5EM14_9ACTN|nr:ABC transporter substrate-binding protein [Jatrophihabitans endophyticus]SHF80247.1 NitT/TauT family transport system substrate-binding protein [Jatrophihabitans endophyticus]